MNKLSIILIIIVLVCGGVLFYEVQRYNKLSTAEQELKYGHLLYVPSVADTTSDKQPVADTVSDDQSVLEENSMSWIDTVMYSKGHAFGYSGDVSKWGGWYFDTVCVGDDQMLTYDSVGPSSLKLSLVTREIIVDLGDADVIDKIQRFMNPIDGFKRFRKRYEECLDSVYDEEYGLNKYKGVFSFVVDYPDSCNDNAGKINRFIYELIGISESEKAKVPGLSASYAGFKQTKNYRRVYTGNTDDMQKLSAFLAHRTFENWKRGGDFGMVSSDATLAIRLHIANQRYITFSKYEYDREGIGHGMYTETFHTFDLKTGNKLSNRDIFKSQSLNRVKMRLFEIMAKDLHYVAWHGESLSATDIGSLIEAWQSPSSILEGSEWEEPKREFKFELPEGALTDSGIIFSFQPYEIDCWAAGAYHFIVPYVKLMPYLTPEAKKLINPCNS